MPIVAALIFVLLGGVLIGVGYLIRVRGMTHLIAGYDARRVRDERGLARWSGGCALVMGAASVVSGLGMLLWPEASGGFVGFFTVVVLALTVAVILGSRRFMHSA